ncbi:MAG: ribosomal RNA small subunit methyltransferase A [Candidatus Moranbacteria bacterium CG23_combo_of_CG06-09_8_20_14_all_35_22]|nr:MAG: ribosomal RNA small subunit methyltransferase A [Candidatus Moranbacteria bacterium CG23_combo_of_CG06-09_8_20_14_all_35_22]
MPTKLGQNFLRDNEVLEKIIASADLKADDFVIEVGPGEGMLTKKLIENAGKILAIEVDDILANKLKKQYKDSKKIEIINADILKINLPEILKVETQQCCVSTGDKIKYKVVANIPYYITSPIIQLFLETQFPPSEMILMVQKEVAERICVQVGQMSILAVSVQYCAKPELLFYVDKKSFFPVPKVDSAVIKITPFPSPVASTRHPLPRGEEENRKKFFRIVKAGFSAKRKTLVNNLSSSLKLGKYEVEEKLKKAGIGPTQRAQELSVEDWKKLTNLLKY